MNKKYYIAIAVLALMITTVGVSAFASAGELKSRGNKQMSPEMKENRQEMKTIFENKDYAGWEALMQEKATRMQENLETFKATITEDHFNSMARLHELKASGDMEAAKALAEELGLMKFKHKKGKFCKGGHNSALSEQ
ncbi:hypothetical protein HN858_04665 [Candidatus Falkowbacteria bacterium]|jgi:hypothetical protein|nr:hypothetical protein [Candidatus Falkowbacteria bacterium]MBT5502605.1 hypothetical protein [Candidatus Falkowbacteria bacterium]MBT6574586.1 hypothetical protein [Candidatus Falkowbacteria bacterium]MBT7348934.1 hypothetical protein [Candidatus Falkowbacteria bacterium]MBT7500339.1 hypothetical protein [Candidatus Falkowbacteria bacterium]